MRGNFKYQHFRQIFAVFAIVFLILSVLLESSLANWLRFLTSWGWVLITALAISSCFVAHKNVYNWILAATVPISVLISIIYWTVLAADDLPGNDFTSVFLSLVQHLLNTIFIALEIRFGIYNEPLPWKYVMAPLLIIMIYSMLTLVALFAANTPWPYPFLDILGNSAANLNPLFCALFTIALDFILILLFALLRVVMSKNVSKAFAPLTDVQTSPVVSDTVP